MSNVLRISDAATIGLHAMVLLADERKPRTTREIAEAFDFSEAHLSKVLQRLVRSRLLVSTRGPGGGFTLARLPKDISLLDVYEAIEGPLVASDCLLARPLCEGGKDCLLGGLLIDLNNRVADYLAGTKLSHLTGTFQKLMEDKHVG